MAEPQSPRSWLLAPRRERSRSWPADEESSAFETQRPAPPVGAEARESPEGVTRRLWQEAPAGGEVRSMGKPAIRRMASIRQSEAAAWQRRHRTSELMLLPGEEPAGEENLNQPVSEVPGRLVHLKDNAYGAAEAQLVHMALEDGLTFSGSLRYITLLITIVLQLYLVTVVKIYASYPSVMEARRVYTKFHEELFGDDGTFLEYVWDDWDEKDTICQFPLANPLFSFIILFIWTSTAMKDVKESVTYLHAWWCLDTPENSRGVTGEGHRLPSFEANKEADERIIQLAPRWLKVLVTFTVYAPKVMLAGFMWWVGCRWLITTNNSEELILNSVALEFVFNTDELFYQCFEPREMHRWVESHALPRPPLRTNLAEGKEKNELEWEAFRNHSRNVFIIWMGTNFSVTLAYFFFQHAIPGYKFDVAPHCGHDWRELVAGLFTA